MPARSDRPVPDRSTTQPIRRLRVVPNPTAAALAVRRGAGPAVPAPVRTGGRHRKPDPDDDTNAPVAPFPEAATTEVVPAARSAALTVPAPGTTMPWPPGA